MLTTLYREISRLPPSALFLFIPIVTVEQLWHDSVQNLITISDKRLGELVVQRSLCPGGSPDLYALRGYLRYLKTGDLSQLRGFARDLTAGWSGQAYCAQMGTTGP